MKIIVLKTRNRSQLSKKKTTKSKIYYYKLSIFKFQILDFDEDEITKLNVDKMQKKQKKQNHIRSNENFFTCILFYLKI